jgi:hypothetical protein
MTTAASFGNVRRIDGRFRIAFAADVVNGVAVDARELRMIAADE